MFKNIKLTKKSIIIIVLCLLLIIGLVLGLIFGIKGCSSSSSSSSSEPTTSETSSSPSSSETGSSSGESSSASSSEPGHTHTPGTPVKENEVNATCTLGGSYDLVTYCTSCTAKLNTEHKTTDPLGHDLVHHSAQSATCTEDGWNAYDTCSRCDYTTYEKIDALGHDYDDSIAANVTYTWLDYATGSLQKTVKCNRDTTHDAQVTNVTSKLTVHTNSSSKGSVAVTSGYGISAGESITVTATPASLYDFGGWYNNSDYSGSAISSNTSYTFDMPNGNLNLYAKFASNNPAVNPVKVSTTEIQYGLYPQSQVDASLETALDDAKGTDELVLDTTSGYYKYTVNNNYYAEANSNWYECEPISWKILNASTASTNGFYYLVSDYVLNKTMYKSAGNNYKDSALRAFLNDDFYNAAFAFADEDDIKTMEVDNSASTTDSTSASCTCENTYDKVTALSYTDMNTIYGTKDARRAQVSEYGAAIGVYSTAGYAYYWTRSPRYTTSGNSAWCVYEDGGVQGYTSYTASWGIRPAIQVNYDSVVSA